MTAISNWVWRNRATAFVVVAVVDYALYFALGFGVGYYVFG